MLNMLTGNHTSNCVHNAHNVAMKNMYAFYEQTDQIKLKELIEYRYMFPLKS